MSSDTPLSDREFPPLEGCFSERHLAWYNSISDKYRSLERQLSALRAERDEAHKALRIQRQLGESYKREELHTAKRAADTQWALSQKLEAAEQRCATLKEERDGQLTEIRRLADFVRQVLGEAFSREELRNEARLMLNNLSSGGPSK